MLIRFTGKELNQLRVFAYYEKAHTICAYNAAGQKVDSLSLSKDAKSYFAFYPIAGLDSVLVFANTHKRHPRRLIKGNTFLSDRKRNWHPVPLADSSLNPHDTSWGSPGSTHLIGNMQPDNPDNPQWIYFCFVLGSKLAAIDYPILAGVNLATKTLSKTPVSYRVPSLAIPRPYYNPAYQIYGGEAAFAFPTSDTVYKGSLQASSVHGLYKRAVSSRLYPPFQLDKLPVADQQENSYKDGRQVYNATLLTNADQELVKMYNPPVANATAQSLGLITLGASLRNKAEAVYSGATPVTGPFYYVKEGLICRNIAASNDQQTTLSLLVPAGKATQQKQAAIAELKGYEAYLSDKLFPKVTKGKEARTCLIVHLTQTCTSCVQGLVDSLNTLNIPIAYIDYTTYALQANIRRNKIATNRPNVWCDVDAYGSYFSPPINPVLLTVKDGHISKTQVLNPRQMAKIKQIILAE